MMMCTDRQGLHRGWLCLALLLCVGDPRAAPVFDAFGAAGFEQRLGRQVPMEARFTDQHGQVRRLGDLLTRPTVLVPVYYNCPNICQTQLLSLFNILASVDYRIGQDYNLVVYSFDPRERPEDAQRELQQLGQRWPTLATSPAVYFLVGDAAAAEQLSEAIGFRYRYDPQTQQYAHASAIATLSAQGRLMHWLYGLGYQSRDVKLALTEAGEGKTGSLGEQLLLLCYHYDPRTGSYDSWVNLSLQVGGIATCLMLAGYIGLALWRDKRRMGGTP